MKRTLQDLHDHVVLCGYGQVGSIVASQVRRAGVPLVVIERNEAAAAAASDDGLLVIRGEATEEISLADAGITRARGLVAALDTDEANVYLILIAREIVPKLRIAARAERTAGRRALRRAGADRVIVPGEFAAHQLSHLILKPRMSEFLHAAIGEGEYEFAEVEVREFPNLVGRSLRELQLPERGSVIIISVIDEAGATTFSPTADTELTESDTLLVVTHEHSVDELRAL